MPGRVALCCCSLLLAATTAFAVDSDSAEKAKSLFLKGQTQLAQGEFAAALETYEQAAAADPEDLNYQVSAAVLKRVIKLREMLPRLADTPKWSPAVKAVYSYCLENHAYAEALSQASALHAKQADGESAALVARVHLEQGDNEKAAGVLNALSAEQRTDESRTLLGIALARGGDAQAARAAAQDVQETDPPDPSLLYDRACFHGLLGDLDAAADCLTRAFENTPPSRLEVVKAKAQASGDLAKLREQPSFAKALNTESKVVESKCSSGASCAQCPSRTTCESGKEKEKQP